MFGTGLMAMSTAGGASGAGRAAAVEDALRTAGQPGRDAIAGHIADMVPVEMFIPESSRRWRPLVRDWMRFVFAHLSGPRLAAKLVEQFEMPSGAPPETRLIRLVSRMPGLQKLGQVLARNRRLPPALCAALSQLENSMSDVTAAEVRAIIVDQLGSRLETFSVELAPAILSEASVGAVMRFTWKNPGRERERGVFKVLKPYVPSCFGEDLALLQQLGEYVAAPERGYEFAVRDVTEMLTEVRLLLEHELDFAREQATLAEAHRIYRASIGIRVPRVIAPLCTGAITAMSEEKGVKVTDAFRRSPARRNHIAEQLIEALIAVPLFSRERESVFHADPHAGNLFYNEPDRELIILDWALAERLGLDLRRGLVMLVLMTILRKPARVAEAVAALSRGVRGQRRSRLHVIRRSVERYFENLPPDHSPGTLDAMRLLDGIALEGVRFPPSLFLFRKSIFTLDGVLNDVAGAEVQIDQVIARDYLTRWISSFGLFRAPLRIADLASVEWSAVELQARKLWGSVTGSARASPVPKPSPKPRSARRGKSLPPALRRQ